MSELTNINKQLEEIYADLKKIDLTKEEDVSKISQMASKPISKTEQVMEKDEFGEQQLDYTIGVFKQAKDQVEQYDPNKDFEQVKKDPSKAKKVSDIVTARKQVKSAIAGKYDELTKKKEVIAKYMEKYDPKFLVDRQKRKLTANQNRIESNNKRSLEVSDFEGQVSGELGTIKDNLAIIKELEAMSKLIAKQEQIEQVLNSPDASTYDKDMLKVLQDQLKENKANLEAQCSELTGKYGFLKLDPKNLKGDIAKGKNVAENNIKKARKTVELKLTGAEAKYGYTAGFEQFMKERFSNCSDEEFANAFTKARSDLEKENVNIDFLNREISSNIEKMELGQQVIANGTPTGNFSIEPTEQEIEDLINNTPEIASMAPALASKKDEIKATYEFLKQGKKGKFHPIAFLKSFTKKAQNNWRKSYESKMREEAAKRIKATKQAEADKNSEAATAVQKKGQSFRDALVHRVVKADGKTTKEMLENADKKPGDVLVETYNDIDDGFDK